MYIKRHIEDVLKSAINEKGTLCVKSLEMIAGMRLCQRRNF